ncbi:hypothetical protein J5X84_30975 [Streptosporangiaceae bacterium NEAU-GS5]|nr:hypothetical protein [Streptosporangiaceae bacterium NEAU-GS5]
MKTHQRAIVAALGTAVLAALTLAPAASASTTEDLLIQVIPGVTTEVKESNSTFLCPPNQVLTSRQHIGDENGRTQYTCSRILINSELVTVSSDLENAVLRERDSNYTARADFAMVARSHKGDENGSTTYSAAAMSWHGRTVGLTNYRWTIPMRESSHIGQAAFNEVMTGRKHSGDENGNTSYQFATVTVLP